MREFFEYSLGCLNHIQIEFSRFFFLDFEDEEQKLRRLKEQLQWDEYNLRELLNTGIDRLQRSDDSRSIFD